jgi:hypothetical protein
MKKNLSDEEVSYKLVNLYFQEIARLGFKRRLDLDSIINAYLYCLERLKNKEKELESIRAEVMKEETRITTETKEQLIPSFDANNGK